MNLKVLQIFKSHQKGSLESRSKFEQDASSQKDYSFFELIKNFQANQLVNMVFQFPLKEGIESQVFFQIKLSKFIRKDKEKVMLQFIDISKTILYDMEKAHNVVLSMINACVSHEMRNPLNSIIA